MQESPADGNLTGLSLFCKKIPARWRDAYNCEMKETIWGFNPIALGWLLAAVILAWWNSRKG